MDITGYQDTSRKVMEIRPDVIIHTAALTNVDYCEENREQTWKINVEGTRNLAEIAEKTGSYLIYISTDSVFDGKKGLYKEEDKPNPQNYYAKTKLEGEKVLQKYDLEYAVIRTSIFGWNIQNKLSLAEWILEGLKNKRVLTMFKDVFFSPILVNNLAEAIVEIYQRNLQGVWHVAGVEKCSKLHFAYKIAEIFGLDDTNIKPISVDESNLKAKRANDLSLDVGKAVKKLSVKLLDVEGGLIWMKQLLESGYVHQVKEGLACKK
jgi:dTDP-4-dehydrorhamnose reductase